MNVTEVMTTEVMMMTGLEEIVDIDIEFDTGIELVVEKLKTDPVSVHMSSYFSSIYLV